MPGRTCHSGSYRYGFNGKENDPEDGWQDYGMRMYDTRLARFFKVDPVHKKHPHLTPYQFASGNPIMGIDFDGLEFVDPRITMTKEHPILMGIHSGVTKSATNTYNFFTHDAYQPETWIQAGLYIDELTMSSSPFSGIYNPSTPKLDAQVANMENKLIKGDAYSRTEYLAELGTDLLTAWAVDKGIGRLKIGFVGAAGKALQGTWVPESIAGWSKRAIAYQEYVTGVKAGAAFEVNGVKFDGVKNNVLIEAKSSYDNFINKNGKFYDWFNGKDALVDQARRQIKASGGSKDRMEFCFTKNT